MSAIDNALYNAFGQRNVSTMYRSLNQYFVIMELKPEYQRDVNALGMLYIRSQQGELVPLSAVSSITQNVGPLAITHSGQLPSVTISFNLARGYELSDAVDAFRQVERGVHVVLDHDHGHIPRNPGDQGFHRHAFLEGEPGKRLIE